MNNLYRFYKQEKLKNYSKDYVTAYVRKRVTEVTEEKQRLQEMRVDFKFSQSTLQIGV